MGVFSVKFGIFDENFVTNKKNSDNFSTAKILGAQFRRFNSSFLFSDVMILNILLCCDMLLSKLKRKV